MKRFIIAARDRVRLSDFDPRDTGSFRSKDDARKKLQQDIETLAELQDKLYAQARHGVLVILQGIDTAGKDGAIKHVMTGINAAGVTVYSFKEPSSEEQRHDYLWRAHKVVPPRGRISIFNRSYYEDVVVTRVHPELLGQFAEEARARGDDFWEQRFSDIMAFERYLSHNGIAILKFFLHISKEEQKKRLLKRIDDPSKHWKFSAADLQERSYWDRYVSAYEQMLSHTSETTAPWYVIPADRKWFARMAIADIIVERLKRIDPQYPKIAPALERELQLAKAAIVAET
ncbi:MAG: polyphosphate kinase 2 family protein [Candidatus Eremiobacteraeota bacterium]|nr:polyphosphate kinase 2 family protein [Candidatus Eremiobacteraeota bacterium]